MQRGRISEDTLDTLVHKFCGGHAEALLGLPTSSHV